jgi:hypothetical protein
LTISNGDPNDGFSEKLDASIGGATGGVTTNGGTFSLLAAGGTNSTSLAVGISTATAGVENGTATINLTSDGLGTSGLGTTELTSEMVDVTGTVYALAQASAVAPNPVNFGNFHVGAAAPSQLLTITNSAASGGFSEALDASIGGATGGVTTNGGTFSLLAAGGTNSTSLAVGISTATAGAENGTATINLTSDGLGTSGLGTTALTSQTVTVTGTVFRLAQASISGGNAVSFGIVHVGDDVQRAVSVSNVAANDGFSESLDASIGGATAGVTTNSGSLGQLAAGGTNSTALAVGINTLVAGSISGTATVSLKSDGTGTSGLGTTLLAAQTVTVTGQVNNFASPIYLFISGLATLSGSGNDYTLNFGSYLLGDTAPQAQISLSNGVAAPADSLAGNFMTNAPDFTLSGFNPFSGLNAGQSLSNLFASMNTNALGQYSETIVLNGFSQNTSGYDGSLASVSLTLEGQVVPEPSTIAYVLGGVALLIAVRRRTRRGI